MLLDRRWNGQEGCIPNDRLTEAEPLNGVMKVKRTEKVPPVMVRMKRVEKIAATMYNTLTSLDKNIFTVLYFSLVGHITRINTQFLHTVEPHLFAVNGTGLWSDK